MKNEDLERIFNIPVTKEKTVRVIADLQKDGFDIICKEYNVTPDELISEFITELCIPDMTFAIAYFAMRFLADSIVEKENVSTLKQAIRDNILIAGIYMTNVSAEKRAELEGR